MSKSRDIFRVRSNSSTTYLVQFSVYCVGLNFLTRSGGVGRSIDDHDEVELLLESYASDLQVWLPKSKLSPVFSTVNSVF